MKIYEKIFARLEELHMSQTELSRRTGIATSTISDWRKKQINPQADKLVSICKALDMTLVELLCVEENEEQTATNDYVSEENYMIELFRQSDTQSRRRIISYLALFDVCKQINVHGFEEGGKTSGICGKGHRQKSGFLGRYDLGGIQGVF